MKYLVVLAAVVTWVSADVAHLVGKDESNAEVKKSFYELKPDGPYEVAYETSNGIYSESSASLRSQNAEVPYLAVKGGYRYTAPDGTPVEVNFEADEQGFKPAGALLPVPPPIPAAIARSLEYIAAHQGDEVNRPAYKPTLG